MYMYNIMYDNNYAFFGNTGPIQVFPVPSLSMREGGCVGTRLLKREDE
jgi:hypothetical protein